MQLRIWVTPSKILASGITPFSLLKTKLSGSLLLDLELVKTVQPNFLIVLAKKLPLKPHPRIKNLFFLPNKLAGFFMLV
jgi:hypothetical protein